MKRVLALLLVLVLSVCALAACTGETEEAHVHTFATTWTTDAEGHWYAATCSCSNVEVTKLAHTDKNNDGACDVCEYKTACADGHTYAEEWTIDCTNHWHAADCGHIVAGVDVAAHADTNADGKCDVCAYVINDIHNHYFSSEWTSDEAYHWNAALCEHTAEIANKEAHNVNAAGICTVCEAVVNEIDKTDIGAVLDASIANNDKVVNGSVIFGEYEFSGAGEDMYLDAYSMEEIYFVLGNGTAYHFFKTFVNGQFFGGDEYWYEYVSEDEVFGVGKTYGDYRILPVVGAMNHLNGYTYNPGSILPSIEEDTSTLANVIAKLYGLKAAGVRIADASESYNEATGVYTFAFTYHTVNETTDDGVVSYNVEAFNVLVEFTVDENFVIDTCEFAVAVYHNLEGLDNDLTYDPENDTYTLNADANPSVYSYSVGQTSGERTFTSPYSRESLIPKDFTLYEADVEMAEDADGVAYYIVTAGNAASEGITVTEGDTIHILLADLKPATGSTAFITSEDLKISFVNKNSESDGVLYAANEFNPYYSNTYGYIGMATKNAGEYTVTVEYNGIVKTFDVTVEAIGGSSDLVAGENEILVVTTDTYGWFDEYTFTADAEGVYGFTVPAGLGVYSVKGYDSFANAEVDFNSNTEGAYFEISLRAGDTYTFYVGAFERAQWIISYSFVACEVNESDADEEIGGGTVGSDITGTFYTANGVLVIGDGVMTYTVGDNVTNYTYVIDGTTVTYTINGMTSYDANHTMAAYFGYIVFDTEGKPSAFVYNGSSLALSTTAPGGDEGGDDNNDPIPTLPTLSVGQNNVEISEEEIFSGIEFEFVVTEEGNYTFDGGEALGANIFKDGMMIGRYSADLAAGTYTIKVFSIGEVAGEFVLNVTFVAPGVGGEENTGSGTASDPYIINSDSLPLEIPVTGVHDLYYSFTASEAIVVTITYDAGNYVSITGGNWDKDSANRIYTLSIEAGEIVSINPWGNNDGTYVISVYNDDGGDDEGGDDTTEEYEIKATIWGDCDNEFTLTEEEIEAGYVYFNLMVFEDGEYSFGYMWSVEVLLDGVAVETNDNGCYELSCEKTYVVKVDVRYDVAGDAVINPAYQYPAGHPNNPTYLSLGEETVANYNANYSETFYFYANATGLLTVSSSTENALIMIGADLGYAIESEDGVVSMMVTQGRKYYVAVISLTYEPAEITFTASIEEGEYVGDGSVNLPTSIVIGENSDTIDAYGGEKFFQFIAPADGTLTLTTTVDEAAYLWLLGYDIFSYDFVDGELTIDLYEGSVVYLRVCENAYDGSDLEFSFTASFKSDPVEEWLYVVNLDGTVNYVEIAENSYIGLSFYDRGNYTIIWDNADAIFEVNGMKVTNGATFMAESYGTYICIYLPDYAEGVVRFMLTPAAAPSANGMVVGENIITVTDPYVGDEVSFTAPEDGTYAFTTGEDAVIIYDYSAVLPGNSISIQLAAGETITFNVANYYAEVPQATIIIALADDSAPVAMAAQYRYIDSANTYHRYMLVFNADGTGEFKEQNFANLSWSTAVSTTFTFTYADGLVVIDFADGTIAVDGSYDVTADQVLDVFTKDGYISFTVYE